MTAVWPSELPQRPLRDPYRRSLASGRQLTSADSGPPRSRRRYSRVARPASMAFIVTLNQLARFWRFHDEELDGGTLPFWIRDPVMNGVPVLTTDGAPILIGGLPLLTSSWWLCILDQDPPSEASLGGGRFQLSVPMLVMP
ncbi:MAG: hypothetical protein J0I31_19220 [Rhizobiales bacterium]|nr:hypothetical protein [Hyphomicrobiales bacterium]